jgi:6-phosphogluconate dehydrogenase
LVEITRDILRFKDADGKPLVEKIRDTAGQVNLFSNLS